MKASRNLPETVSHSPQTSQAFPEPEPIATKATRTLSERSSSSLQDFKPLCEQASIVQKVPGNMSDEASSITKASVCLSESKPTAMKTSKPIPAPASLSELQALLTGKELLKSEIPASLIPFLNDESVYRIPGIQNGICMRCGNRNPNLFAAFPHAVCHQDCMYCRKCVMMGRISACTDLYGCKGPSLLCEEDESRLNWTGSLSPLQQKASTEIIKAIHGQYKLLVWAVCGAGKTEMVFAGIEAALQNQKRVCLAAPRTDVILELAPRLRAVFPHTRMAALYGGSEDGAQFAPLILSTTHQLLRYKEAFDVMIVDEVDAFPFSFDQSLQYAVKKACKPESTIIYLTATPDERWQREFRLGKRRGVLLPARFHRHPIPVPTCTWIGPWHSRLAKGKLPAPLRKWLHNCLSSHTPYLIFFPSISVMEKALPLFQEITTSIASVHAEDPLRKEKVKSLRDGNIQGLLTTTILERGITIPNLQVAVLGAEEALFTESALVQIAGRVGRSPQYPDGDVTFFHYGKTKEILAAVWQIEQMNREAEQRGLLH